MKRTVAIVVAAGALSVVGVGAGLAADMLAVAVSQQKASETLTGLGLAESDIPGWLKRTELSGQFGGGDNEWEVLTVQPLWEDSTGKGTFFTQLSALHYEDFGDSRFTTNAGLGYRQLMLDDRLMVGVNLFYDHEWQEGHDRASIGLEARSSAVEVNANAYRALSGAKTINSTTTERALDGWDGEVGMQIPYIPWTRVFAQHYEWEGHAGRDTIGQRYSVRLQPVSWLQVEAGRNSSNGQTPDGYARVAVRWAFGQPAATSTGLVDDQAFRFSESVADQKYERVRRENRIVVERATSGSGGLLTVSVSRGN